MSERKRERVGRCQMCLQKVKIILHDKCYDCRVSLQFRRYAKRGRLGYAKPPKVNVDSPAEGTPS